MDRPHSLPDQLPLDWTKLPEELRYLARPAVLFGQHAHSADRHEMIQTLSDAELIALASLSKVTRTAYESRRISDWLAQYQTTDAPEARLVRHLIELMDEFIREI